jgi:hypothetical protein
LTQILGQPFEFQVCGAAANYSMYYVTFQRGENGVAAAAWRA